MTDEIRIINHTDCCKYTTVYYDNITIIVDTGPSYLEDLALAEHICEYARDYKRSKINVSV